MWQLVHQWSFLLLDCLLTVFDDWYTVGTVLVDMWRLVHQWWFLLFWLFFDWFWRMVHCTNRQKHSKPLVDHNRQDCTNSIPTVIQSSKTVKRQSKQQKWALVYQSSQVYKDCTNSVLAVYQSSKTVKRQSKQQKWPLVYQSSHVYQDCTNSVPTVYNRQKQSKRVKRQSKQQNEGLQLRG